MAYGLSKYSRKILETMEYIGQNSDINNRVLYESILNTNKSETMYIKRVTEYISQCEKLKEIEKAGALNHEEAKRVLIWCNDQINTEWNNELAYRKAIASLGMKLMMIFGITYRELRKIKHEQINTLKGTLFINGFNLRLPMGLSVQINRLIKFQNKNGLDNKQYSLLVNLNGKPWGGGTSSSGMPEYVSAIVGNRGLSSLIKYGIGQMSKTGINDSVIKKLTGASDKLLSGCILVDDEEWNRMLNNKIVTVELYYDF